MPTLVRACCKQQIGLSCAVMCCACLTAETARAPEGLESYKLAEKPHQHPSEEDEEKLKVLQLHTWHLEILHTAWALLLCMHSQQLSAAPSDSTALVARCPCLTKCEHYCNADSSNLCSSGSSTPCHVSLHCLSHIAMHLWPHHVCSQQAAEAKLKVAYEHIKPEARKLQLLGHGNGFSFEATPFCSYADREGIHVVLAGEVSEWPGISAVAAAHDGELCSSGPAGVYYLACAYWPVSTKTEQCVVDAAELGSAPTSAQLCGV
jgi:hypothetical protein